VAVPNVTAIDWKQADAYGPGQDQQGGMSFTVKEARAASVFSEFLPARFTCVLQESIRKIFAQQRTDETSAA
jgi:hypothetical protein